MKKGFTHKDPTLAWFFQSRGAHQAKFIRSFPEAREQLDANIRMQLRLAVMYGWLAYQLGISLEDAKERFDAA